MQEAAPASTWPVVQRGLPCWSAKPTVPVASAGSPPAARLTALPNAVLVGSADAVNEVAAGVMLNSVAAVEPQ